MKTSCSQSFELLLPGMVPPLLTRWGLPENSSQEVHPPTPTPSSVAGSLHSPQDQNFPDTSLLQPALCGRGSPELSPLCGSALGLVLQAWPVAWSQMLSRLPATCLSPFVAPGQRGSGELLLSCPLCAHLFTHLTVIMWIPSLKGKEHMAGPGTQWLCRSSGPGSLSSPCPGSHSHSSQSHTPDASLVPGSRVALPVVPVAPASWSSQHGPARKAHTRFCSQAAAGARVSPTLDSFLLHLLSVVLFLSLGVFPWC